jgi:hypothetical protein
MSAIKEEESTNEKGHADNVLSEKTDKINEQDKN